MFVEGGRVVFVFVCTVTVAFESLIGFLSGMRRRREGRKFLWVGGGVRFVWVERGVTLRTSIFLSSFFCLKFWLKGFEV